MKEMNGNQIVRTSEINWEILQEEDVTGVCVKPLLFEELENRSPTILLKFEAGATYPLHTHPGGEEIYVLEGDAKIGKDELKTGDYHFTAIDNMHRVGTKNGCVLLVKTPKEVVIIEPRG